MSTRESAVTSGVSTASYSPTNPLAHLTNGQIEQLMTTFKKLDADHNGFLDQGEIMGMLTATFPDADLRLLEDVRAVIFDTADRNGDGKIDLNEFLQSIALGQGVLPAEVEEVDPQVNSILSHLSSEEIDMFRDAFIKIDRNGDGFIDRVELLAAVKTVVGNRYEALKLYLDQIFEVADKDLDGKLSLTEFLASFAEGPGVVPHDVVMDSVQSIRVRLLDEEIAALQESFIQIDVNRDGYIDAEELKVALKKILRKKFPDFTDDTYADMVSTALKVADKDGDGMLNLAEFIRSYQEDQGVLPHAFSEGRVQRIQNRLSDEEISRLNDAFAALDDNNDGYIDSGEMQRALRGILDQVVDSKEEIDEIVSLIMTSADQDGDGRLTLTEFITSFAAGSQAMDLPIIAAEERIKQSIKDLDDLLLEEDIRKICNVFYALDQNKDGFLDKSELESVMVSLLAEQYPSWDKAYVEKIMNAVISGADTNNDGRLSLEEFVRSFFEGHGVLPEDFIVEVSDIIDAAAAASQESAPDISPSPPDISNTAPPVPIGIPPPVGVSAAPVTDTPATRPTAEVSSPASAEPTKPTSAAEEPAQALTVGQSPSKRNPPPPPADVPSPTRTKPTLNPTYFPNDISGVAITHEDLWDLFNQYDSDKTGSLNRTEFKRVYRTFEDFGLPPSDKQIDKIFSQFSGGDDKISFNEFAIIMLQRSKM